jgi:hypothetical protein
MEVDNGGWTLVANIAPADGNSVGYDNQDFWSGDVEYGSFDTCLSNDYKSPLAMTLTGTELMTESATLGQKGTTVRGWRKWEFTDKTWDSMFTTGHGGHNACGAGNATSSDVGTFDEWDNILRQGNCLSTGCAYGSSDDMVRIATNYPSTDNTMGAPGRPPDRQLHRLWACGCQHIHGPRPCGLQLRFLQLQCYQSPTRPGRTDA